MKQSDIFVLILVAGIGTLASFFICNMILGDPNEATVEFKTVSSVIEPDLVDPNPEIFNSTAINPTIEVYVGDCVDMDRNGILDMGELAACGRVEAPEITAETPAEELERLRDGDYCITISEPAEKEGEEPVKKTLCDDEKVEYINGLLGGGDQQPNEEQPSEG